MSALIDMTGRVYGRLSVVSRSPDRITSNGARLAVWSCVCECGAVRVIPGTELRYGKVKSCGCLRIERFVQATRKHGHSQGKGKLPEYAIWKSMKNRCYNPHEDGYQWYGARGITVCERWRLSFEFFLDDMGRRPTLKHTLDRIDNNGDYEPRNCRWATLYVQARNRRNNVNITIGDRTMCATDWASEFGFEISAFLYKFRRGKISGARLAEVK